MANSHFLKKLISVGEKNILSRLTDFTELAYTETEILIELLVTRKDLAARNEEVREIEKVGDEMNISVKHDLTTGAISPNLLDTFVQLVEKCDDILDNGYFISREVKRMFLDYGKGMEQFEEIAKSCYSSFGEMLELNKNSLKHLNSMLLSKNGDEIRKERLSIEKLEERVDEIKDDTMDYIYSNADKIPYLLFSHFVDLTHKVDDMADDCEDASDLIMTITRSITT